MLTLLIKGEIINYKKRNDYDEKIIKNVGCSLYSEVKQLAQDRVKRKTGTPS